MKEISDDPRPTWMKKASGDYEYPQDTITITTEMISEPEMVSVSNIPNVTAENIPPGVARKLALDLLEAADEVEGIDEEVDNIWMSSSCGRDEPYGLGYLCPMKFEVESKFRPTYRQNGELLPYATAIKLLREWVNE